MGREAARVNPRRVSCPQDGERVIDLDAPEREPMCPGCRVLGPDGKPVGWQDGRPTECGDLYLCPVCDAVIETTCGGDPECAHPLICAETARDGNYVAICDLPRGHLDEPHNDDLHQECRGLAWRYVDGRAEFD